MKELLVAMFVALLMVGGGEQSAENSNDTDDNASALPLPVADPVKVPVVEKWAEWAANPKPYGGLKVLALIRDAGGRHRTRPPQQLYHRYNAAGGFGQLGVPELRKKPFLPGGTLITDLAPLAVLTKLESLDLRDNRITDDQKAILRKALPKCRISFR